jgi:hypothetical protein
MLIALSPLSLWGGCPPRLVGWLVFSFFHESQIASFFFYLLGIPFIPATVAESKLFFAGDCYRQFPFCVFNSGVSGLSASVVHHRVGRLPAPVGVLGDFYFYGLTVCPVECLLLNR